MAGEDFSVHYEMAKQYELQGKLELAVEEYDKVLRINPDHASAHYNLAMIYRMQGNFKMSDREFEEVRRINPNFIADDDFDIVRQKARTDQHQPAKVGTKRFMSLPIRIIISLVAAFIIGGPVASVMGTNNITVGVITVIVVFLILSVLFRGER